MEPQKISMVPDGSIAESKPRESKAKMDHIPAMRIPEKATGAQVTGATNFNNMRQCLLENGLMESK